MSQLENALIHKRDDYLQGVSLVREASVEEALSLVARRLAEIKAAATFHILRYLAYFVIFGSIVPAITSRKIQQITDISRKIRKSPPAAVRLYLIKPKHLLAR